MIESNPLGFSLEKIVKNALYEDLGLSLHIMHFLQFSLTKILMDCFQS